jgi:aspartyl-tRNA(Asn)/glutamyl-tRNA(Gln) amidotransferase subunit B
MSQYGLPEYDAQVITASKDLSDYFERCVQSFDQPKTVSNWVMGELLRELNQSGTAVADSPVTPGRLVELLKLVERGTISLKAAREIFPEIYRSGKSPEELVRERGITQVSDETALGALIDEILEAHPAQVAQYRGGKQQVLGFFVGQIMKASAGKANPGKLSELLKKRLAG